MSGKVYLVGAGPGHPELLTVKAVKLLESCDVVVYDRLIQEEVLAYARPSAERIYMGKAVGRHDSRQQEIHDLLARKAGEGKTVVRLKGGDPFLFGRGGEEAEFLAGRGIPFEVIPGVSSALAAPLSAGIAVTHRDVASAVAIVTGHEACRDNARTNWRALAEVDTLVFLMSVHSVGQIAAALIANGRDPDTPAAMIQMAFWRGEQVIVGTLSSIAAAVDQAGVSPPATLVVGEAVRLREKLESSARDLCRRAGPVGASAPAPSPDQLLRLATAGIGSQVLVFALATNLFAQLEEWRTARDLARALGMNAHGLAEALECLVSLGLLECGPRGYRNLELASLYLLDDSPRSLRPALLALAAHLAPAASIGRYVLDGRESGCSPEFHRLQLESCACLARYAAPFVIDRLDFASPGRVLLFGRGGDRYRDLASRQWPALSWESRNPFADGVPADPCAALPNSGRYDVIVLSMLLACCDREQYGPTLARAAGLLAPGGALLMHDFFLCAEGPSPPEVALAALRRHVVHGGSRNWSLSRVQSELERLGLRVTGSDPIPGGAHLVRAQLL